MVSDRSKQMASAHSRRDPLRIILYDRLKDGAYPLFDFDNTTIPGASVWTGARQWVESFRRAGLEAGDRLLVALPEGPEFIQVLVAGLWNELSLHVRKPGSVGEETLKRLDVRAGVVGPSVTCLDQSYVWRAEGLAGPSSAVTKLRPQKLQPTPGVRLWLRSSGSTGKSGIYGLSAENILSVVNSHVDVLNSSDVMLSYLPWTHCFGLIMDLFMAIDRNMWLIREPTSGRSPQSILRVLEQAPVDHLNTVPKLVKSLENEGFRDWSRFSEGIVGGAPIDGEISSILGGTNFRVGYGQTEASPGISLGQSGHFEPGLIGRPVGCSLTVDDREELIFSGRNAHRARFFPDHQAIVRYETSRQVRTGDSGEVRDGTFYFRGRLDDRFKLPNGKYVDPLRVEDSVEEDLTSGKIAILPDDHSTIRVVIDSESSQEDAVLDQVQTSLNSLWEYVSRVEFVSDETFPTTNKGEVDRSKLKEKLSNPSPERTLRFDGTETG